MDGMYCYTPPDATKQPFYAMLNDLYRSLSGSSLTAEALAEALIHRMPQRTLEDLTQDFQTLRIGMRNGQKQCREMLQSGKAGLSETKIAADLHELMQQCPPEERKPRLLSTIDYLCANVGYQLSPGMCGPLAASTEKQLESDVAFLISKSGVIALDQLIATCEATGKAANPELAIYANRYSQEEHLWIAAAVAYVAQAQTADVPTAIDPLDVGEEVGQVYGILDTLADVATNYIAPGVIGVAGSVLGSLLLHKLPDIALACEAEMMKMAFFASESVLSTVIMALPSVALSLGGYVLLCAGFLGITALAMRAYEDIREHMKSSRHKTVQEVPQATQTVEPVIQPVVPAPDVWVTGPQNGQIHV